MEQVEIVQTLKTSLAVNIWAERNHIILCLITAIVVVYARLSLLNFFGALLGIFIFSGVLMFGFVGIVIHMRYYFSFERNRKVDLYPDRMVIIVDDKIIDELFKKDILKITLFNKIKSSGATWPTFIDPFYYIEVSSLGHENVILTCLLDTRLKKKIAAWHGQNLEHTYQFFPFPPSH